MAVDVQTSPKINDGFAKDEFDTSLGESQIGKVFAGSTVLVTGGTGFLGRLLVEKLLRSCPDLKKIYLLARPKKNKEIAERLKEQFNDVLYDRLKKERPQFMEQIGVIEGDIGELNAGISEESRQKLINEVDVIFHGAATVRFDEELQTAVHINVRGPRELLLLARACTKLRAFVHISTAYSNCPLKEIREEFYQPPIDGEKLIALADQIDAATLNKITPALLGVYPNTYAFTKSVAENIVQKYSKGLPVVVYRPSIVISTMKEPMPGWINNVYGPTGIVVGAAVGLMHVHHCNPDAIADLVPGDMVVNGCIAAAWKMARDYVGNHEDAPPLDQTPTVYNFVSSVDNPLLWKNFMDQSETYGLPIPPQNALWYYSFIITNSQILYNIMFFFLHWVPAYIVDGIAVMLGKKPMLKHAYGKIKKFSSVLQYFGVRDWKFQNANINALFNDMCPADQTSFNFDISSLSWDTYFKHYVFGIRTYLLKESMDNLKQAKRKYFVLKVAHYTLISFISVCFIYLTFKLLCLLLN